MKVLPARPSMQSTSGKSSQSKKRRLLGKCERQVRVNASQRLRQGGTGCEPEQLGIATAQRKVTLSRLQPFAMTSLASSKNKSTSDACV